MQQHPTSDFMAAALEVQAVALTCVYHAPCKPNHASRLRSSHLLLVL